ncbi:hypothetical protein KAX97_10625 [candidate division WOR-3 bacterium]|nr:hypothetical protein [candidate division WOR-3 bacterium]
MAKLMEELGIGFYTKEKAVKIVENLTEVPDDIAQILKHAETLLGKGKDENAGT